MPAEVQAKVFDPFRRKPSARAGLGLTVAYAIAHEHGGRLRVESGSGRGASFSSSSSAYGRAGARAAPGRPRCHLCQPDRAHRLSDEQALGDAVAALRRRRLTSIARRMVKKA
jgi:hypothetical protein